MANNRSRAPFERYDNTIEGNAAQADVLLSQAASGDNVVVHRGTFTGNLTVPSGVTLEAVGPVTIDGDLTFTDSTSRTVGTIYVTGTVTGGVIERPAAPSLTQGGYVPMHESSPDQWMLPYVGALIAIRGDDIREFWSDTTYQAVFGSGISPLKYAWSKGVRVTLAAPSTYVEDSDDYVSPGLATMDSEQLRTAMREFGAEICCHSATHAAAGDPRAASDMMATINAELIASKRSLESLTSDDEPAVAPGNRLGIKCKGWVEPGTWGAANSANYTDSRAEIDDEVSRAIRENYEWGMNYALGDLGGSAGAPTRPVWVNKMSRYHASYYGGNSYFSTTYATTLAALMELCYHGARVCILFHLASSDEATKFKHLVDAIAAIRDDKATYPLLHCESVTISELMLGLQPPLIIDKQQWHIPVSFNDLAAEGTDRREITLYKGGRLIEVSGCVQSCDATAATVDVEDDGTSVFASAIDVKTGAGTPAVSTPDTDKQEIAADSVVSVVLSQTGAGDTVQGQAMLTLEKRELVIPKGCFYEDFERFTAGTIAASYDDEILSITSVSDSSIQQGDQVYGKFVRLPQNRYIRYTCCAEPGRSHMVRFVAKASAALSCGLRYNWYAFNGETDVTNYWNQNVAIGTSWAVYRVPLPFPGWSNGGASISLVSNTAGQTLDIAEICVL